MILTHRQEGKGTLNQQKGGWVGQRNSPSGGLILEEAHGVQMSEGGSDETRASLRISESLPGRV